MTSDEYENPSSVYYGNDGLTKDLRDIIPMRNECTGGISISGSNLRMNSAKVIVEPITNVVDVNANAAAIEKTFSSNFTVVRKLSLDDGYAEALKATAKRLLNEIIADEKKELENNRLAAISRKHGALNDAQKFETQTFKIPTLVSTSTNQTAINGNGLPIKRKRGRPKRVEESALKPKEIIGNSFVSGIVSSADRKRKLPSIDESNTDRTTTVSDGACSATKSKNSTSSSKNPQSGIGEEQIQYPCTVCRTSSITAELRRCYNCPRYFHAACFVITEPSKRNLCPKCARVPLPCMDSESSPPTTIPKKKPKLESRKSTSSKAKIQTTIASTIPSSSFTSPAIDSNNKSCPGCKKRFTAQSTEESIYCSNDCVESVIELVKLAFTDPNEAVLLVDSTTGEMVPKLRSPPVEKFGPWLKKHLQCYPILPTSFGVIQHPPSAKEDKPELNLPTNLEKSDAIEDSGIKPTAMEKSRVIVDQVRLNVRKAFRDVLILRSRAAEDVLLNNEEIKELALELEQNVHKYCHGTKSGGVTYRQQIKNLLTNLRSDKNRGLFRRFLNGKLPCKRLATMTAEEMASTEFSSWAGEDVNRPSFDDHNEFMTTKSTHHSDCGQSDNVLDLVVNDTTAEHKSHFFNLNCKICTGKQKDEETMSSFDLKKMQKASTAAKAMVAETNDGNACITREDGKFDVMVPFVTSNLSDPLNLNSASPCTDSEEMSPASVSSASSKISLQCNAGATDAVPEALDSQQRRHSGGLSFSPYQSSVFDRSTTPKEPVLLPCWHGLLHMRGRYRFQAEFMPVSGPTHFLKSDLPHTVEIVGRLPPHVAYEYLSEVKKCGGKDIIIFSIPEPTSTENRLQWNLFYDHMNNRNQFAVVDIAHSRMLKDCYCLPLPADRLLNSVLLPFDGPGLENQRKNTILGIIVRHRESASSTIPKNMNTPEPYASAVSKGRSTDESCRPSASNTESASTAGVPANANRSTSVPDQAENVLNLISVLPETTLKTVLNQLLLNQRSKTN